MRQRAEVIGFEDSDIIVRITNPSSACGKCNGCIRLTGEERPEDQVFPVRTSIPVDQGDQVIIESAPGELFRIIAILYGIPLIGLLLGYFVSFLFIKEDALAGLGSLGGLILFVFVARIVARRAGQQMAKPRIVAKACS